MKSSSHERGQALILIAFAAVGLFAFAALAIDGSRAFSNKRNAQNAADTAVLAAALAKARGQDYAGIVDAAVKRAASNGYTSSANNIVEVHLCNESGISCQGMPVGADPSEFIQVRIVSTIPSTFGRVIGRNTLTSAVEAIARVQGTSSTSSSPGDALVALRNTDCGICGDGATRLIVNGSGIFSNSTDGASPFCSINVVGAGGYYQAEQGFTMATGGALCKPNGGVDQVVGDLKYAPPLSVNYNIPAPNITCPYPGAVSGTTVTPGYFNSVVPLNAAPNYTFQADGNYCFRAGFFINGAINVTANHVNILIEGGDFQTIGHANLTCTNTMFYVAGGTGIHLNGTGSTNCTGVTFYLQTGDLKWNGTSTQVLKAPTSDTYKGLLIYVPASNGSELKINGTSSNQMVGSIIAPGSHIMFSGVSGSAGYNTQIIGSYFDVPGVSNTVINYDPSAQYNPPGSPTIQLTK